MKEKIIKVVLKGEPERLRGGDPAKIFPITDIPEDFDAGSFTKAWEAFNSCKAKFGKPTGQILVFGTSGEI